MGRAAKYFQFVTALNSHLFYRIYKYYQQLFESLPLLIGQYYQLMDPNTQELFIRQKPDCPNICMCFNPLCTQYNRIFPTEKRNAHEAQCSKWIIDLSTSESNNKAPLTFNKANRLIFNLQEKPIYWFFNSSQAKDMCKDEAKKYLEKVKKKVDEKLSIVLSVIEIKLNNYFDPIIDYCRKIKDFISQINSNQLKTQLEKRIFQIMQNSKAKNPTQADHRVFRIDEQVTKVQQETLKLIDGLTQKMFCDESGVVCDIGISELQKGAMIKYFKNPEDDHNKRWQKMSRVLKADKKLLYDKKLKNSSFIITCPICKIQLTTQFRKEVMSLWNMFSTHLIEQHPEEIGYHYKHLVLENKYTGFISVEQILFKMINYSYEGLQIICKSGRKFYNFFYTNRKKLTVDFLSKGEYSALPIQKIETLESYQFYSIISVICYALHKSPAREKLIHIFTNNAVEINNIRRLSQMFWFQNVRIQTEKRAEEETIIYQESEELKMSTTFENDPLSY